MGKRPYLTARVFSLPLSYWLLEEWYTSRPASPISFSEAISASSFASPKLYWYGWARTGDALQSVKILSARAGSMVSFLGHQRLPYFKYFVNAVPVHEKSGTIGTILNEENSLIMTKSLSLDDGLKELTERVNEALNEE